MKVLFSKMLIMMIPRWLPWVKECEDVRGSKRQGGGARGGDERREAELAESGFAVERSRLRISSRPKGNNRQEQIFLVTENGSQIYVPGSGQIGPQTFWLDYPLCDCSVSPNMIKCA